MALIRRALVAAAPWLLPIAAAWAWFCTMRAVAWGRIQGLQAVENYAFAVYDQLIWTYAHTGTWAQTIHYGYVDHWMWSGHRSLFLFPVAWLYRLDPGPFQLAQLQIALVALGALPAFGLGRNVAGGALPGGILGLLVYLGFPPLAVVALNDYQDLVLGVPFAIAAAWAARAGSWPGFVLAAAGMVCAREEWAAVVPTLGLGVPGGWKPRLKWIVVGALVSAAYLGLISWLGRDFSGYGNQTVAQVKGMGLHGWHITRPASDWNAFYRYLFLPVTWLAVLSPGGLAPAVGLLLVHASTPPNGGIDTQWRGHVHHVAPALALLVVAALQGGSTFARMLRLRRDGWRALFAADAPIPPRWLAWGGVLAVGLAVGLTGASWTTNMGAVPRFTLALPDVPEAAVRKLVRQVPEDASVATDTWASLAISSRRRAYTYDESLRDKAKQGLRAVDWVIVDRADAAWVKEVEGLGGAQVDAAGQHVLYRMPWAKP